MKTILLSTLMTVLAFMPVFAQTNRDAHEVQTLFQKGSGITGWFIDFSHSYSQMNNRNAHLPGFKGGINLGGVYRVGFFGKSLTCHETWLKFDNVLDEPAYLVGGYGGLMIESSPMDSKLIHINFSVLTGAGGAEYLSQRDYPDLEDLEELDFGRHHLSSSAFWAFEPGADLEINLTGFMRVYAGYSYRWMVGMNLESTPHNAFNGHNFNFGIRFGKW